MPLPLPEATRLIDPAAAEFTKKGISAKRKVQAFLGPSFDKRLDALLKLDSKKQVTDEATQIDLEIEEWKAELITYKFDSASIQKEKRRKVRSVTPSHRPTSRGDHSAVCATPVPSPALPP